jgi:hypothetical protein
MAASEAQLALSLLALAQQPVNHGNHLRHVPVKPVCCGMATATQPLVPCLKAPQESRVGNKAIL